MKNKYWYIAGTGLLIYFLMGTNKTFANIVTVQKIRNCDPFGCGSFGADRSGHQHQGIDIVAIPNEKVFSPIAGTITRFPFPYNGDIIYTGIEIKNDKYAVKMFYVSPLLPVGRKVLAGQLVAKAQNIAQKYGSSMINHVHIEVRDLKGNLLNPTNLF